MKRILSWRSWFLTIAAAVILAVLTTLALECLFRHGPGDSGCHSGACGDRCAPAGKKSVHPGVGHAGGHGEANR